MDGEVIKRAFIRSWSEGEVVVPCPADKPVNAIADIDMVGAVTAVKLVGLIAAIEDIDAGTAVKTSWRPYPSRVSLSAPPLDISQFAQESVVPDLAKEDGVQASGVETPT